MFKLLWVFKPLLDAALVLAIVALLWYGLEPNVPESACPVVKQSGEVK